MTIHLLLLLLYRRRLLLLRHRRRAQAQLPWRVGLQPLKRQMVMQHTVAVAVARAAVAASLAL